MKLFDGFDDSEVIVLDLKKDIVILNWKLLTAAEAADYDKD
jgi:hypothetical protein